jgi:hypothetical protein
MYGSLQHVGPPTGEGDDAQAQRQHQQNHVGMFNAENKRVIGQVTDDDHEGDSQADRGEH